MIKYIEGNIFDSKCEALTNPVNCVGVMGKGLALQFKERYPHMFWEYKEICDKGILVPGIVSIHRAYPHDYEIGTTKYIINFPTKLHWKDKSDLNYIQDGLHSLLRTVSTNKIRSVALPMLGCGLGGLMWSKVEPLIHTFSEQAQDIGISVEVYIR